MKESSNPSQFSVRRRPFQSTSIRMSISKTQPHHSYLITQLMWFLPLFLCAMKCVREGSNFSRRSLCALWSIPAQPPSVRHLPIAAATSGQHRTHKHAQTEAVIPSTRVDAIHPSSLGIVLTLVVCLCVCGSSRRAAVHPAAFPTAAAMSTAAPAAGPSTYAFNADIAQLMSLIINTFYSVRGLKSRQWRRSRSTARRRKGRQQRSVVRRSLLSARCCCPHP